MDLLAQVLPWIQVILAILLITTILLQQSGAGVGGAFGGGDSSAVNYTRRGAERTLFQATIVIGVLFALSAFASLFI